MIAADTCSLIAFFSGDDAADTHAVTLALQDGQLVLPPVVLMEILSDPYPEKAVTELLSKLSVLELQEGYWVRAAKVRQVILANGLKAKLGDTLTAQSCIDYQVPLITRDKDFRHYAKHCGLKIYHD